MERLLGCQPSSIERIPGGRNGATFLFSGNEGRRFVAKVYFRHDQDSRDRLGAEFEGLKYLWDEGVRDIPKPVAADREQSVAVFDFIEGEKISSGQITPRLIHEAAVFLGRLHGLGSTPAGKRISAASEACFSLRQAMHSISLRLERFPERPGQDVIEQDCHDFLSRDFIKARDEIFEWCERAARQAHFSSNDELPEDERTLSPSDFGFHNAIRRVSGQVVFIDFEYFGWDDPAKMIADFLLHPGNTLTDELRRYFVQSILGYFHDCPNLKQRLAVAYPLYGLKWCMILLNEFVPQDRLRRDFAQGRQGSADEFRIQQLGKARAMLDRVRKEFKQFPFYD